MTMWSDKTMQIIPLGSTKVYLLPVGSILAEDLQNICL
jgi:hypothetical protein